MNVREVIRSGHATTPQALEIFDSLDPVDIEFMLGSWVGTGFHTDHPFDGLLELYHWHGKRFDSAEAVDPLVFRSRGGRLVRVSPRLLAPGMVMAGRGPLPRSHAVVRLFELVLPLMRTRRPRARLRMTDYRGKTSATMIYDQLPANDVFRRVDANTVLGLMDMKDMSRPFFFLLRREGA